MSLPKTPKDQRSATVMGQLAPYMALGSQLAVTVLLMGGIGWLIDNRSGSTPWGLVVGLGVGSVVGFIQFLRSTQRLLARDQRRKAGKENGWT